MKLTLGSLKHTVVGLVVLSSFALGSLALQPGTPQAHARTVVASALTSLPVGSWSMHANGYTGTLQLTLDPSGTLISGTMFGDPINGFWDYQRQRITFVRSTYGNAAPPYIQQFTGYLFYEGYSHYLTGTFTAFTGTGATAQRSDFGWVALR